MSYKLYVIKSLAKRIFLGFVNSPPRRKPFCGTFSVEILQNVHHSKYIDHTNNGWQISKGKFNSNCRTGTLFFIRLHHQKSKLLFVPFDV